MKISVITACYNRERTIARTIESVRGQTWGEVEHIVVDGKSTDGTMAIVERYRDTLAKVVSERDGGIYEALNKGVAMSTGDVVGWMHSDDVYFSDEVLERVALAFERGGAQVVYGDGVFVDPSRPRRVVRDWVSGPYARDKVRRGWLPLHPTVYVRREVFDLAGGYDESYRIAADSEWLVRILHSHRLDVHYLGRYMVRMDMGGASTSLSGQLEKLREDLRLYRAHGFNSRLAVARKMLSKVGQF